MTQRGEIKVIIQKKNPKKNAKAYRIETVQDIFDAVTSENIKGFLSDLEMVLQSGLLIKASGVEVELPYFEWIDD